MGPSLTDEPDLMPEHSIHFDFHLLTADDCERRFRRELKADGSIVETQDSGWEPREPEFHTTAAVLVIEHGPGGRFERLELTGEQYRDLESYGAVDELLRAIGGGAPPSEALERTLRSVNELSELDNQDCRFALIDHGNDLNLSPAARHLLGGAGFYVGYWGAPPRENSMVGLKEPTLGRLFGVDGRDYDGIRRHEPFDVERHSDLVGIAAYGIRRMVAKSQRRLIDALLATTCMPLPEAVAATMAIPADRADEAREHLLQGRDFDPAAYEEAGAMRP